MNTTSQCPAISLRGLFKKFGQLNAVDGVSLDIADGEFFSMLGPSGSGKTTVLRLIAGFEQPTAGEIVLAGRTVTGTAPFDRNVNTVFQDYALFPHMSVLDNVAYGLRVRKMPRAQRRERAREALNMVQLGHLVDRRPTQLSGGQRQRVALARAIVVQPKVLLLDEPLGALDQKLREQMQVELKSLQRELGITFIFVTHDQQEALTLSDRIAVFNNGQIVQVGTPRDVYESPQSEYVATFVGTSNVFEGAVSETVLERSGTYSLRPEKISIYAPDGNAGPRLPGSITAGGVVAEMIYLGEASRVIVDLHAGQRLNVLSSSASALRHGDRVEVSWQANDLVALSKTASLVSA